MRSAPSPEAAWSSQRRTSTGLEGDRPQAVALSYVPTILGVELHDDKWKDRAACLGRSSSNYDPWSPPDKSFKPPGVATEICNRCPVKRECLIAGLEGREWGVWGGLTRRQRLALSRPRNRVSCPICDHPLVDDANRRYGICMACGISWRKYRPDLSKILDEDIHDDETRSTSGTSTGGL